MGSERSPESKMGGVLIYLEKHLQCQIQGDYVVAPDDFYKGDFPDYSDGLFGHCVYYKRFMCLSKSLIRDMNVVMDGGITQNINFGTKVQNL